MFLLFALALPRGAHGQPRTNDGREAARPLAEKGIDFYQAGRWSDAIRQLQEAESRFHAPTHVLLIARAHEKLGQLVEAEARYRALVSEVLPSSAPDAFREAQASGSAELTALLPRIPHLRVLLTGPDAARGKVTVDGRSVEAARPIAVNPGAHTVIVSVAGSEPVERVIDVAEGASHDMQIVLGSTTPAEAKRTADAAPPPGSIVPGVVAFGLGGIGLAVGVATGLMSLQKVDELDQRCPSKRNCAEADRHLQTEATTLGTISTIGFVAGGVAVAAGVVLLAVGRGGQPRSSVGLRLRVGASSLRVDGAF